MVLLAALSKKKMSKINLSILQKTIGVKFKNENTLKQALIHRSYLNENKNNKDEPNERYEFLGDAVLELWVSSTLFNLFPSMKEGDLTNLRALIVCTQNLAKIASSIELGNYVALSKGEELHGGRQNQSILADTFEALIGAVYLEFGFKKVELFLHKTLDASIENLSSKKLFKDPKSLFQEIAQSQKGITPSYKTINEQGPDHQKTFTVGVYLNDKLIATGSGNSKQKAEESAAVAATTIISQN